MTSMHPYHIEHDTRGILVDLEPTESGNQIGRFSPTKTRNEALRFTTKDGAINARNKIRPERLQKDCQIMVYERSNPQSYRRVA
jgi:hypothetical protein